MGMPSERCWRLEIKKLIGPHQIGFQQGKLIEKGQKLGVFVTYVDTMLVVVDKRDGCVYLVLLGTKTAFSKGDQLGFVC